MFKTRTNKRLLVSSVIFFILLSEISLAQSIEINKSAPLEASYNETITIVIKIHNPSSQVVKGELIEPLPQVETTGEEVNWGAYGLGRYLSWSISLQPNETKTIKYRARIDKVGIITYPSSDFLTENKKFSSNYFSIEVKCLKNGKCEPEIGENFQTCPEDCPSGSEDEKCDFKEDGICDPDCTKEADPDCQPAFPLIPLIISILLILGVGLLYWYKH